VPSGNPDPFTILQSLGGRTSRQKWGGWEGAGESRGAGRHVPGADQGGALQQADGPGADSMNISFGRKVSQTNFCARNVG
jgi:hypothetical protein